METAEQTLYGMIAAYRGAAPMLVGIAGPQGSGKSTLAARIARTFPGAAILSLDDLYLPRADRRRLAEEVHPLLATRGVPGTHDVALGLATIAALRRGEPVALPRFDKASDERVAEADWPRAAPECPLIVLEGWCLGAPPMPASRLVDPVNALEAAEDRDGVWRRWVDARLAQDYPALWEQIDALLWLAPPSFETVLGWRREQEAALRRAAPAGVAVMDNAAVERFVAHYERITRWMIETMPAVADRTVRMDAARLPAATA